MTLAPVRITPDTAEALIALFETLGHGRRVEVTVGGDIGAHPYRGCLSFESSMIQGVQVIACSSGDGLVMPIPVMPPDFRPQRDGDAYADYRVGPNVVTVTYHQPASQGWRRFQFAS